MHAKVAYKRPRHSSLAPFSFPRRNHLKPMEFLIGSPHVCEHRQTIPTPPGEAAPPSPSYLSSLSLALLSYSFPLANLLRNGVIDQPPKHHLRPILSSRPPSLPLKAIEEDAHAPESTLSSCTPS
jgi:hypothetical protein